MATLVEHTKTDEVQHSSPDFIQYQAHQLIVNTLIKLLRENQTSKPHYIAMLTHLYDYVAARPILLEMDLDLRMRLIRDMEDIRYYMERNRQHFNEMVNYMVNHPTPDWNQLAVRYNFMLLCKKLMGAMLRLETTVDLLEH